jgi:hypothetical protein
MHHSCGHVISWLFWGYGLQEGAQRRHRTGGGAIISSRCPWSRLSWRDATVLPHSEDMHAIVVCYK